MPAPPICLIMHNFPASAGLAGSQLRAAFIHHSGRIGLQSAT